MSDNYLSGVTGYVKINTIAYSFSKWRCPMKCGLPKVTNFNSAPYQLLVAGIFEATIEIEGPYNQGNMPFTAGTQYIWLLGWTTGIQLSIPGYIETLQPDVDVEGAPRVNITVRSSGPFTASIT